MHRYLKTPEALAFLISAWIVLVSNAGFWQVVGANAPAGPLPGLAYFASFLLLTIGLVSLVMLILSFGRAARLTLGLALVIAASASYFTSRFGTLFDPGMLTNVVETDPAEASELITLPFLAVVTVAGVLPALAIWRYPFVNRSIGAAILHRCVALVIALSLIAGPLFASQKEIFSVARNHREIRHMIAPLNVISASYVTLREHLEAPTEFHHVGLDATHASATTQHRKPRAHVLIVGETARAANFELNGYEINTNPELSERDDIWFLEASSCGTATAVSLPCMFSIQERAGFNRDQSHYEDNLLDVAMRSGYHVLWIDNGNGCKGICARVEHRDVHSSRISTVCPDGTCFDEILVEELRSVLDTMTEDTLIVLHGLGSHGPAYFRRYPERFRLFQPDCQSPNFGDCTQEQITNSYDNTIAYADHFIATAIDTLAAHSADLDTSLLYVSDHGESLGEHGLYLHGMPYKMAPDEQTTVPMIFWADQGALLETQTVPSCVDHSADVSISHDNLFHTELGLLEISTASYRSDLDILSDCQPRALLTAQREVISGASSGAAT